MVVWIATIASRVDPAAFILGVAELVRLGDAASIWVPEIATQLERWT